MAKPKDQQLYDKVKKSVYSEITKHSAYRSGQIVKRYKNAYEKKYGSRDAYLGNKKTNQGLDRWFKEDWRTQTGKKEYEKKGDIFRPTKRITKETPKTMSELSKADKQKAIKEKKKTGKVKKY
jgi:hypothetical protein